MEEAANMTEQEYSRIVYALWKAGVENIKRTEFAQAKLTKASAALEAASQQLPVHLARHLDHKFPDVADKAARMIAHRWTEANVHAERATAAYIDATGRARKTIYGAAAVLIATFACALIILALWIFPRFDELAKMRDEKVRLETTINQLTLGGARANVQPCVDGARRTRLCVQIDETAKTPAKGWRVIGGY